MTITAETNRSTGTGDDVTTTFPYSFEIADETEIDVYIVTDSTGARSLQTLTTHYSVTGVGSESGGNIEFVTAPASGETVVMVRDVPFTQETNYTSNGPLSQNDYTSLEAGMDRLQTQVQQLQWQADRCIQIPDNNTITNAEVTDTAVVANRVPSINASVNGVELVDIDDLLNTVTWINSMTEYTTVDLNSDSVVVWDNSESEHRKLSLADLKTAINFGAFTIGTSDIDNDAVTNAKLDNMAADTIKGRANGAGTGDPQDLTAAQVRTIINVEDGATADQTAGEIEAIVSHDNLLDFSANEHIDWTSTSSNFSTSGTAATGSLTVTGNISVTGTVDGRDLATDGTKLDGIESGADVTDEANVTDALDGATLTDLGTPAATDLVLLQDASDSNILKVAQFSTFGGGGGGDAWSDPVNADIVPDADGTRDLGTTATRFAETYTDALDVTNNIVVGGTVDGRDLATDGTKLDGIESGADVTDAANVETSIEAITLTGVTPASGDEFLVIDATDGGLKAVDYDDISGGSGTRVLISTQTASSSSSIDFTGIAATYDKLILEITNLVPATDQAGLQLIIGTGAGPTYDTSGSNYRTAGLLWTSAGTGSFGSTGADHFLLTSTGTGGVGTGANEELCGTWTVSGYADSGTNTKVYGDAAFENADNAVVRQSIGGNYNTDNTVTALRVNMSSGNIASGTFSLYGITK